MLIEPADHSEKLSELLRIRENFGRKTALSWRRTERTDARGNSSTIVYDPAGRSVAVTDARGNTSTTVYHAASQTIAGIDALGNRSTSVYDAAGQQVADVNPLGNRETMVYDDSGQAIAVVNSSGRRPTTTYDADGNQSTVEIPLGDLTTYSWDNENENTLAKLSGGTSVTQTYNGDLIVVEREETTGTIRFVGDRNNILLETNESDVTQSRYDYAPQEFGELITARKSGSTLYYHFDALGSTVALTNAAGTETDATIYDAWGNVVSSTGTTEHPFLWVGQLGYYFDAETGLYLLRRRALNSTIGRFLSEDPIWDDDPANIYRYTFNSPIHYVDPSGLRRRPSFFVPGNVVTLISCDTSDDDICNWKKLPRDLRGHMMTGIGSPEALASWVAAFYSVTGRCITTLNISGHGAGATGVRFFDCNNDADDFDENIPERIAERIRKRICKNGVVYIHSCGTHDKPASRQALANKLQRKICMCPAGCYAPFKCHRELSHHYGKPTVEVPFVCYTPSNASRPSTATKPDKPKQLEKPEKK